MGKVKSLACMLGGVALFDYAAHQLGAPGLKDLCTDIIYTLADEPLIGATLDTMLDHFGTYCRDFFYDGYSALGTVGQTMMYGGLGSLIHDSLKKPEETKKD